MRDFLDSILAFIGSTSLTDIEFGALDLDVQEYSAEVYEALDGVLRDREEVSTMRDRLKFYFQAKGTSLPTVETGRSNITIGGGIPCGD